MKLGDYELNKIYNEDCYKAIKKLPSESIDLIITSPPYDNLRTYENEDIWNFDKFKMIANELSRVLKKGGVIVWIISDATINGSETGTSFKQALYFKEQLGLNLHDTMIWEKGSCPFPSKTRYYQSFEYMFVFSKGKLKTFNPLKDRKNKWYGEKVHGTFRQRDGSLKKSTGQIAGRKIKEFGYRFNIWKITPERSNKTGHPAVFPLALIKDHIISWSNEKEIVLDCFMGSGTTAVACKELNRNFIGFEINKKYYDIACKRLEEAKITKKEFNLFDL